jgi:hypothetical protein
LVFCGFNFRLLGVRQEGYLVLLIAFVQIFISFGEILDNWGVRLWTDGFINLLSLGVIFGVLKLLLNHYRKVVSEETRKTLPTVVNFGNGSEDKSVVNFGKGFYLEKNINYWLFLCG